jgi:DNA-binding XRE family transcriptional regulator
MRTKAVRRRLYLFRCENGLTQEQFAEKIGFKRDTYSKIENGSREPSMRFCKGISEAFGISIADAIALMEGNKK